MDNRLDNGSPSSQRGLFLVEMVIVILLILLMAFGTAEVGRYIYQFTTLNKAVRDGARYLSSGANDAGGIIDLADTDAEVIAMKNLVVFEDPAGGGTALLPGFTTGDVTWNTAYVPLASDPMNPNPNHVVVSASYIFQPVVRLPILDRPYSATLTASSTMRALP
jgi:Flp pilus assembly protein TadG